MNPRTPPPVTQCSIFSVVSASGLVVHLQGRCTVSSGWVNNIRREESSNPERCPDQLRYSASSGCSKSPIFFRWKVYPPLAKLWNPRLMAVSALLLNAPKFATPEVTELPTEPAAAGMLLNVANKELFSICSVLRTSTLLVQEGNQRIKLTHSVEVSHTRSSDTSCSNSVKVPFSTRDARRPRSIHHLSTEQHGQLSSVKKR